MKTKRENSSNKLIDLNLGVNENNNPVETVCGFCKISITDKSVLESMG